MTEEVQGIVAFQLWRSMTKWLMNNGYEKCQLCESKESLTFDHIWPASRGGPTITQNLAILCSDCNGAKGDNYIPYLRPLEWPHPSFGQVEIQDLKIGMFTVFGVITDSPKIHYIDGDKILWEAPHTGYSIVNAIKRSSRSKHIRLIRPEKSIVLLHPENKIEGKRMAG